MLESLSGASACQRTEPQHKPSVPVPEHRPHDRFDDWCQDADARIEFDLIAKMGAPLDIVEMTAVTPGSLQPGVGLFGEAEADRVGGKGMAVDGQHAEQKDPR